MSFPEFLYGDFATVSRAVAKEAKRWAKAYRSTSLFPEPTLREVEAGSVVVTSELPDLERGTPRWRLYFVELLLQGIKEALGWRDRDSVVRAFESHTTTSAWGALAAALGEMPPNSRSVVAARVRGLLGKWEQLESLRYIGKGPVRIATLAEVVGTVFSGLLTTWENGGGQDIRSRLSAATDRMERATAQELELVLAERMVAMVRVEKGLSPDAMRADVKSLGARLQELDARTLANMESGQESALRRALYILFDPRRPG